MRHWILCFILGHHDWTCAAEQGKQPTKEQLTAGIEGFYSYVQLYCKHCGIKGGQSWNLTDLFLGLLKRKLKSMHGYVKQKLGH